MSDTNAGNGSSMAQDPFSADVVEDTIAASLRQDAPAMPTAVLVRSLADAYTLPPAVDAVLARSRATLAHRAEALGSGTVPTAAHPEVSSDTVPETPRFSARRPLPTQRRVSSFATAWRTLAAVLVVTVLVAGFFALLHGIPRPGARPKPTRAPISTMSPAPSPTVPAYLLPTAPLLPVGWTWYRDSTGHFQVPLPPGWRTGTFYSTDGVKNCEYRIQFFPPGTGVAPSQASATFASRLIEIDVNMSCPPSSWSSTPNQPYIVQEPNPVIVDGQPVVIWDNVAAPGEVDDFADATFHGHQFGFAVQSRDSNFIVVDAKVFHQMLHGFEYTGLTLFCAEPSTTLTSPTARVTLTPVPSQPPAQILSAVEALPGFQNPVQVAFAPSNSTYSYDPPVLILPATVGDTEGNGYYAFPHYIIRASVNGVRMVTYDVTYNPTTHAFSLDSFGPMASNDPAYGKAFPWVGVSSSAAAAALCSAKGITLATSTVPELVFFAPGPQITNTKSPTPSTWTGGGCDPTYPMWRLHGADGQLYFVGIDGKVYAPKQLPVLPGTTFITHE